MKMYDFIRGDMVEDYYMKIFTRCIDVNSNLIYIDYKLDKFYGLKEYEVLIKLIF